MIFLPSTHFSNVSKSAIIRNQSFSLKQGCLISFDWHIHGKGYAKSI